MSALVDENSETCFIDQNGVTCFTDQNGNTLCCTGLVIIGSSVYVDPDTLSSSVVTRPGTGWFYKI